MKTDNKGFTLIETMLCFVILGIIMVIASQIIHSSTETYYLNRSVSYGMQAAQIVSTEIRGEIEDALPMFLYDTEGSYSTYYMRIDNSENSKCIEFVNSNGEQIKYLLENDGLKKYSFKGYDEHTLKNYGDASSKQYTNPVKIFDSKYIGMGYEVRDISLDKFIPLEKEPNWKSGDGPQELEIGDYPILVLTIKVGNKQYEEYECKEYIVLYNFYGIETPSSNIFNTYINIAP